MNFDNLTSNDWPNVVYLSILALVLISSLFLQKNFRLTVFVKYVLGWLVIGILIILGYSFRYDLLSLKDRINGELFPSSAKVNDMRQVVISRANDGHFYIDMKLNDQMVRFMVDTGASDIVLDLKTAIRVGIDAKNLRYDQYYQTANGGIYGASTVIEKIIIGNLLFRNVWVSVNDADMGISLLGMSFLQRFSRYEFYRDKLVLTY